MPLIRPSIRLGHNLFYQLPVPSEDSRWWSGAVGVAATRLIYALPERLALVIKNNSTNYIYISNRQADVVQGSAALLAPGDSVEADAYPGDIWARATGANSPVTVIELYGSYEV